MPMDRRDFMAGTAALSTAALAAPALGAETAETLFDKPYVDVDEWRDTPVRHRYVHGGFRGTEARFVFYLPPKPAYQGRFFQYVTPVPMPEDQAASAFGSTATFIGFCIDSGAFAVASNQGGFDATATPGSPVDPSIAAYRVSAATARYARAVAAEMYGPHRTWGYAFGGSGGAFRTLGCAENSDAWDGVVPFIHGSAGSIPNNYAARLHGLRILKDKFPQIADALEPGGSGDVYAGLDEEQRAVLREITQMGFPLRTWVFHKTMGIGAFAILFQGIQNSDPGYFDDFWKLPGYQGANPPPSLLAARVRHEAKVKRVILSSEAAALGIAVPGGPGRRVSAEPDVAWKSLERDHGGAPLPVAFQLDTAPPARDFTAAGLFVTTGDSAGSRLELGRVTGDIVALQFGPSSGSFRTITDRIRPGDTLRIDNSNYLAFQTYYRHALLPPDYKVYAHLRRQNGLPRYPQRKQLIAYDFVRSAMGSQMTGKFACKMIVVNCLLDWDAAPWHADWYRSKVRAALGEAYTDRYRLWYVDHGTHGSIPDPTRVISYAGVLQQALRDVSAWAERGTAPPQETSYKLVEGQIAVPPTAAERRGVQPVVTLTANGTVRAEVRAGEPVRFAATIDVPPGAGSVVAAEWDFEGAGDYPHRSDPSATVEATHVFAKAGTYFPALRATSQRTGDAATPYARIQNLGRVRVVVR